MTASDSHIVLRALVDELVRCGMREACTAPGSRNTPIVLALADERRLRSWSHVDERCAGFFALGAAKASGRPVAVTCTSGTAAANLLPAVIEASEARVPLIVLTADRPPELREVGAGQTIDQIKLYGDAVRWFVELGVPEATPEQLRFVRTLACRLYATSLGARGRAGPVHVNVPLREPLVPSEPLPPPCQEPGGGGRADGRPWVRIERPSARASGAESHDLSDVVLVAGSLGGGLGPGRRLAALAERAHVPLLADPLSNARRGGSAIAHYDLILRDPTTARRLAPRVIYRVGELPTSKPLRSWLAARRDVVQLAFGADDAWGDPDGMLMRRCTGELGELFDRLEEGEITPGDGIALARWRAADDAVAETATARLEASGLSEPAVARMLGAELPSHATLLIAASMPIRDAETWFPVRDDAPRVLANRGANGIDGTVSTAYGISSASAGPVVLWIGDVALAHDAGGLLAARRTGLDLTIVLVDNGGGGIFEFLAVSGRGPAYERHVATPTGLAFDRLAEAYGAGYERVRDLPGFRAALARALGAAGTSIVHLITDRVENRSLHRELEAAAMRGLHGSEGSAC
jgi:2-succinyl-5-enolpyruvyl-6-hydroxy-3-cyclohexene-1-carboxylate synthase